MQVNVQSNEQAGNLVNDIFAAIITANTLIDIAKAIAADVVRPRRGSLTAIYFDASFEDFEEHSSVGVVKII